LNNNEEQHTEETSRKRSEPLDKISYHQKLKTTNKKQQTFIKKRTIAYSSTTSFCSLR
jgi:hypothetical protein